MDEFRSKQLFEAFKELFPTWADKVSYYKKIGSRALMIIFKGDKKSKVFLYYGPDNWQFGTKLWRKVPKKVTKNPASVKNQSSSETCEVYVGDTCHKIVSDKTN